jgi:hypothetical protein
MRTFPKTGASVFGRKNVKHELPNQEAFFFRELPPE